jgi:hypothetical protein
MKKNKQLISYIAPSAPATRRVAAGNEPFLRPEIGFTPNWFHQNLDIDFGLTWHSDPEYRQQSLVAMRAELKKRFPKTAIGQINRPDKPLDLLTGTYGACTVAAIYGVPIIYSRDNWPNCAHQYLDDHQFDNLNPPDLDSNPFFQNLLAQVETIVRLEGTAKGFINWQGVLNNAQRLRGENIFLDLFDNPKRIHRLFDCVCTTMIDACKKLHAIQKQSGFEPGFFTASNCLVNMISPEQYRDFVLPYDRKIAETFDCIGIHNCAWTADPYLEYYAQVPTVGYIDMGLDSDLAKAKELFPDARRALMYTPMDLANKDMTLIRQDMERIAKEYGPCDVVVADIEAGTPDEKVLDFVHICNEISDRF